MENLRFLQMAKVAHSASDNPLQTHTVRKQRARQHAQHRTFSDDLLVVDGEVSATIGTWLFVCSIHITTAFYSKPLPLTIESVYFEFGKNQ